MAASFPLLLPPSSSILTQPSPSPPSSLNPNPSLLPPPLPSLLPPLLPTPSKNQTLNATSPPSSPTPQTNYTWASRVTSSTRSLKKVQGLVTSLPNGNPRVKIPNSIFLKGEAYHREFIVCLFYGDPPSTGKVYGVLNFLLGKNQKLEIHRLTPSAYLVRISSDILRQKFLSKELWHVYDVLFYISKWKPEYSLNPPIIETAPIWVHLSGIPFDLITREGLSYIGSLLGDPIDVDDFTRKIRSHHEAHIKVEIDFRKPLPNTLEIEKENGEIIPIATSYPLLPPVCSNCQIIGHKEARCPKNDRIPKVSHPNDSKSPTEGAPQKPILLENNNSPSITTSLLSSNSPLPSNLPNPPNSISNPPTPNPNQKPRRLTPPNIPNQSIPSNLTPSNPNPPTPNSIQKPPSLSPPNIPNQPYPSDSTPSNPSPPPHLATSEKLPQQIVDILRFWTL